MYLSRLVLNPQAPSVKRGIANVHDMHRTLMSAYPDQPELSAYRQAHGVLWRIDPARTAITQLVQSTTRPDWSRLPEGHVARAPETQSMRQVLDALTPGRRFAFRLLANPTEFSRTAAESPKRLPHRTTEAQVTWLIRQAERYGFVIPSAADGRPDLATTEIPQITGRKKGSRITVYAVRYDGHLVVTDPAALSGALTSGIGRAKAYGCGLLSLASPRAR
ncbi:type I-E CRISPR-associated protein Cas6/Cse3/CasE [Actinokineospora spheciospongiae]|uniref:type I-E CRISPR-associated protein Cas6/Cse3/CasE n=1 Tax=Actinokineospora spheciospongiae TaxID=909613 RepID=UPI000D710F91|nr:type I-E CRISPR-associated protein Cas6/Cse3/CasE [Actinokineospora spheciospongiae]PWW58349.1 CRISPR-associated Cse3 family protein [Actinokineospora spheciospongiae]